MAQENLSSVCSADARKIHGQNKNSTKEVVYTFIMTGNKIFRPDPQKITVLMQFECLCEMETITFSEKVSRYTCPICGRSYALHTSINVWESPEDFDA